MWKPMRKLKKVDDVNMQIKSDSVLDRFMIVAIRAPKSK